LSKGKILNPPHPSLLPIGEKDISFTPFSPLPCGERKRVRGSPLF